MEHIIPQDVHIGSWHQHKLHVCIKGGGRLSIVRDCIPTLHAFPTLVSFKPNSESIEHFTLLVSPMVIHISCLFVIGGLLQNLTPMEHDSDSLSHSH